MKVFKLKLIKKIKRSKRVLLKLLKRSRKQFAKIIRYSKRVCLKLKKRSRKYYINWQKQVISYFKLNRITGGKSLTPRLTAVLIIVVLVLSQAGLIPGSFAYFSDVEPTTDNMFQSESLEFSALPNGPTDGTISPSSPVLLNVDVAQVGNLGFQYTIATGANSGSLCSSLNVKADLDNNEVYNGTLSGFTSGPYIFAPTETWTFEVSATEPVQPGATCDFDVLYEGWQEDKLTFNTLYFTDSHEVSFTVTALSDVVINEIMWMGSKNAPAHDSKDEWIELRNLSPYDIDISGWVIENSASSPGDLTLPDNSTIPANGYFLVSNYSQADSAIDVTPDWITSDVKFNNNYSDNGRVKLWNVSGDLMDSAPLANTSTWPKGKNETNKKWSMERNLVPGDGTVINSWHTCNPTIMSTGDLATMQSYWDSGAQAKVCGTPGHINLSTNDPTAPDYNPNMIANELIIDELIVENEEGEEQEVPVATIKEDNTTNTNELDEEPVETEEPTEDIGETIEEPEESTEATEEVVEETTEPEETPPATTETTEETVETEELAETTEETTEEPIIIEEVEPTDPIIEPVVTPEPEPEVEPVIETPAVVPEGTNE